AGTGPRHHSRGKTPTIGGYKSGCVLPILQGNTVPREANEGQEANDGSGWTGTREARVVAGSGAGIAAAAHGRSGGAEGASDRARARRAPPLRSCHKVAGHAGQEAADRSGSFPNAALASRPRSRL